MTLGEKQALKGKIEKVLSEILSDMYDVQVTLKFVPKPKKE